MENNINKSRDNDARRERKKERKDCA